MSYQDTILSNNTHIRDVLHNANLLPHGYGIDVAGAVRDLFQCALSYYNNKDRLTFTYSGKGTMLDNDYDANNHLIDCSSMVQAWLMGVPYEHSRYCTNGINMRTYSYGMTFPINPYDSSRPNRYYANELAHYFYDQGYSFTPTNGDYSGIQPGDIIFMSFENKAGNEFHENAFMKIDHCSLVVGWKDNTHLTCLHTTSDQTISFYDIRVVASASDQNSVNQYNNSIVLVARPPIVQTFDVERTPIAYTTEEFTTTSETSGLLATINLGDTLLENTAYTVVAYVENSYDHGDNPVITNYVGLRGETQDEDGVSFLDPYTIASWIHNKTPDDHIYYMHFVIPHMDIPPNILKLYVLNTSVAGHKFKGMYLYEGLVRPVVGF